MFELPAEHCLAAPVPMRHHTTVQAAVPFICFVFSGVSFFFFLIGSRGKTWTVGIRSLQDHSSARDGANGISSVDSRNEGRLRSTKMMDNKNSTAK
ncbi:hypothetical protein M431DRAFT_293439 [Trichoderma harzianum CBS 226.95]|uniref:Transmembrane protein n=1 Tax=Trichoderma harzianum CBS 226.95 TaxID=983964 RepID=A0A2T4APN3_TRIHA|nr:hypothetical protein M431DRAFT_293439 [Trichoderma harzianum CBS 226.95]PTB59029.1 hypothetical protein M431DRAFT_293439 [Trichoderma harzianum CBS 226.95]